MNKKQNKTFYLFLKSSLFFLLLPLASFGEGKNDLLCQADSLFQSQKYTESFEVYQKIINNKKMASPQMLMKMAYIKEGLGDNSNALYYLNQYYLETSDKKAQIKMSSLAEENELVGYALSDYDFFRGMLNRFYLEFNVLALSVVAFLCGIIVYRKFKSKSNATPYAMVVIALLLVFYWFINFNLVREEGILMDNHAYLMTGPSAGSDLVGVVKKGHRLLILGEESIWLKVSWESREVYVRASKVRRVG